MAPLFPAILFGGPPHSGKSILVYRVSMALRRRGIPHYTLRASPDGEGGWSYEAPPELAAALRRRAKGAWNDELAAALTSDIAGRHLPLLVDGGGKPSSEIEQIASACTHAVLIAADPENLDPWRAMADRQGLVRIADLTSELTSVSSIINAGPMLCGVISGLKSGLSSEGPCFDALVERIVAIFAYSPDELYRAHLALTSIDLVLHLERAIYPLPAHRADAWAPGDLAPLLGALPSGEPMAVYGVGPSWLYAALAAFNHPHPFELFDARCGWVTPPPVVCGPAPSAGPLQVEAGIDRAGFVRIVLAIPGGYLDRREVGELIVPTVEAGRGVVLDGKLPNWLWAGLARAYTSAAWVGVYRPRSGDAVVVRSGPGGPELGELIALAGTDSTEGS